MDFPSTFFLLSIIGSRSFFFVSFPCSAQVEHPSAPSAQRLSPPSLPRDNEGALHKFQPNVHPLSYLPEVQSAVGCYSILSSKESKASDWLLTGTTPAMALIHSPGGSPGSSERSLARRRSLAGQKGISADAASAPPVGLASAPRVSFRRSNKTRLELS